MIRTSHAVLFSASAVLLAAPGAPVLAQDRAQGALVEELVVTAQ